MVKIILSIILAHMVSGTFATLSLKKQTDELKRHNEIVNVIVSIFALTTSVIQTRKILMAVRKDWE